MQRVKTLVKTLAGSIATGSFVVNTFSHNWAVFIVSLYLPCNGDVWSNPGSTYIVEIVSGFFIKAIQQGLNIKQKHNELAIYFTRCVS